MCFVLKVHKVRTKFSWKKVQICLILDFYWIKKIHLALYFLVKQHFGLLYFSALKKRKTKERETEKINK